MRRNLVRAVPVALVLLLAAGAFVLWPRGSSPVTEDDALEDFRSREAPAPASSGDEPMQEGAGSPDPGVYRYRAVGEESIKLGALPAEDRALPDQVTAVVVGSGEECFTITLNLLAQHTEDTTYCGTDGQLTLASHTKHQQVGVLEPDADMTCDPDVLHDGGTGSRTLRCTLTMSGGPARFSADIESTVSSEPVTLELADGPHEAVRVEVDHDVSGDLNGTWREVVWFAAADRLPLRIERQLDLEGPATFTERSELELVDLEPTR